MHDLIHFLRDEGADLRASLIGQFILHHLAKRELSPRELATSAEINLSTLYDYISGRVRQPSSAQLEAIARALELPSGAFDLLRADVDVTRPTDDCGREPGDPDWGQPCEMRGGHEEDPEAEKEVIRAAIEGGHTAGVIEGYASVFNRLDAKGTMMLPGAFRASAAETQTLWIYWEHAHALPRRGTSTPVGISTVLAEDAFGLWFRAAIAATPKGREALTLMDLGESVGKAMGSSVAGDIVEWVPNFEGEAQPFRRGLDTGPGAVLHFDLKEISLAAFPALPDAFAKIARPGVAERIEATTERMLRALPSGGLDR